MKSCTTYDTNKRPSTVCPVELLAFQLICSSSRGSQVCDPNPSLIFAAFPHSMPHFLQATHSLTIRLIRNEMIQTGNQAAECLACVLARRRHRRLLDRTQGAFSIGPKTAPHGVCVCVCVCLFLPGLGWFKGSRQSGSSILAHLFFPSGLVGK